MRYRQGFSGQRGLIDFNRVALEQARVGRNDVAEAQADQITWHQFAGRHNKVKPRAIAFHTGFERQLRFERGDGVPRLESSSQKPTTAFFQKQENCDDRKVLPMPHDAGK